jgi:hypothetical protein
MNKICKALFILIHKSSMTLFKLKIRNIMPVIKLKKQIILTQLILQLVLTQFDLTLPVTTSS